MEDDDEDPEAYEGDMSETMMDSEADRSMESTDTTKGGNNPTAETNRGKPMG